MTIKYQIKHSIGFLLPSIIFVMFFWLHTAQMFVLFIPALILLNCCTPLFGTINKQEFISLFHYCNSSKYAIVKWYYFFILLFFNVFFIVKILPLLNAFDIDYFSYLLSFVIINASFSIAIAHEFCHSDNRTVQFLANFLFSFSALPCFSQQHINNHHLWVATPYDPTSASINQNIYQYIFVSIPYKFKVAFTSHYLTSKQTVISNLIKLTVTILAFSLVLCYYQFNLILVVFLISYVVLMSFLYETVSYIQHYGLSRGELLNGQFEAVLGCHSWNNLNRYTNYFTFMLPLHSLHHANNTLDIEEAYCSPKLPYSLFFIIVSAFFPHFFFKIMNNKLHED